MATRKKSSRLAEPASDAATSPLQKSRQSFDVTVRTEGDWFELIQCHHGLIEAAFDAVIASSDRPLDTCQQRFRRLALLMTAHCVAEENVIYPALALHGLQSESDKLYLDQAHAKVMTAVLDLADDKGSTDWLDKAQALKTVVMTHAKNDEEADLFPRLMAELDATTAIKLSAAYRREFLAVA